jgi:LuxR family maltose regulon positive regulatory protein
VLTELETLGHLRKLPRVVASARLERACMLMRQGNAFGSRAELERSDDREVWDRVASQRLPAHELLDIGIGRLAWEVQFGDAASAARRIEAELQAAHAASRIRRAHKLRVLWAMALWRQNSVQAAAEAMGAVLLEGSREGFARLILDEGAAVAGPVQAVLQNLTKAGGPADPILLEYVQRLVAALGGDALAGDALANRESGPSPTTDAPWRGEPITNKELRVLKLVAEGYSNGAMAEKLFIAESTVRTHLRSINIKLAAQNRTQAVSIARRHGLIG